ncbi:cytochrome c biogenesis CcdA family protein [Sulfitobacter donghicola]|uniref:Cytochrome C biosynthesis protein n=1 Tax=Sulfitobacter donghicola DSW-25 = KCTC 12864 = JCM 14565 TaxID=1300350 RepID=A0A073IEY8_9RHOB|nr:cytochrome c biogenesis CcdA family protein [Sulfitobacter donghicola]KEJ88011.1 cytochrome C biosynthesis protein [Sulfitobacter donghicola DSW-25 = KCTC 12864 = JCM 14565]KIN69524.1 Cytochrome c biogenesis protein transmembrane region [Sulfitobacter donghicola DSW-25 = KCTC 12864 = JCM 14565]
MEFVFAYLAGLLTLINPCVLPVLPIVLVSALNANRYGPIALAAGMSLSFVVFGVLVTAFGASIGLTQEKLAQIGAAFMIVFGIVLLVPKLAHRFEAATAGMAARADSSIGRVDDGGLKGQFMGGILLGAVWSPCIGPTLGGAIALASQGSNLGYTTFIMAFFALGVSTLIIVLGLGAREAIRKKAQMLRGLAARSKPILGVTFLAVGLMLYFKLNHYIEAWALDVMPIWLQDLSVAL